VRRTVEPRCGTVMQDVAGTAQGNWFAYATTGMSNEPPPQEDRVVSLVHDAMYPTRPVMSVGNVSNVGAGRYYFTPQASGRVNRDFTALTLGAGVYCYEMLTDQNGTPQSAGIVLMEVTAAGALNLERGHFSACGTGPWSFSLSMATFDR
jgi:hypothetical protein